MLRLAVEWGKLEKVPPTLELLSGERRRDRVLTSGEEREYFRAAQMIGEDIENAYGRALEGIRAMRGQEPIRREDPFLLRDLTALLIDCGLRPEEAFRLRWDELRDGAPHRIWQDHKRTPASSTERTSVGASRDAAVAPELRMGVPVSHIKRTC